MNMQRQGRSPKLNVPWITIVIAAAAILNPIGLSVLQAAFLSSEQLSRSIFLPLFFAASVILLLIGWVEYLIKRKWRQRPRPGDRTEI